jgi:hypothetical protein
MISLVKINAMVVGGRGGILELFLCGCVPQ